MFKRSVPTGIVILKDNDPSAPEYVVKGMKWHHVWLDFIELNKRRLKNEVSNHTFNGNNVCIAVERVTIGQEEEAPAPEPFVWDPEDL